MTFHIPDSALQKKGFNAQQISLEIAVLLFQKEIFTLAQAASFCHMHRMEFQQELGLRKIPVHYGVEELLEDVKTLKQSS
ncbi:MAG: UPF0175 family protein [Bacteroidia bacterium]